MKKQKIQAIGKDGVIKGEKIVLNAIGSEQYITAEYNDNNEKENLNNDNMDILLKPIYFENIADTITAKLLKIIIENEGYHLLSCDIEEYKNRGEALIEDNEGRPSGWSYNPKTGEWE